jgi:hypothetical protein
MKAWEKRNRVMVSVNVNMLEMIMWNILEQHHLERKFTCPICLHDDGSKHKDNCSLNRAILEGKRLRAEIPDDPPEPDDGPMPFKEKFTNGASNYRPRIYER